MGSDFDPRCHVGEVHGIYTIVDMLDEKDGHGHWIYKGVCNECGFERFAKYGDFSDSVHKNVSCRHKRANGDYIPTGHKWKNQRLREIFHGMMSRCYNSKNKSFSVYGAKGISVYQNWIDNPLDFEAWALNSGYNDSLTIDRIDSSGDYCPENCQWLTLAENTRKAGRVNWITVEEDTLTGRQWAERIGVGVNTFNKMIRQKGVDKTTELIKAMLNDPPITKNRKPRQTWFSVYGIEA